MCWQPEGFLPHVGNKKFKVDHYSRLSLQHVAFTEEKKREKFKSKEADVMFLLVI